MTALSPGEKPKPTPTKVTATKSKFTKSKFTKSKFTKSKSAFSNIPTSAERKKVYDTVMSRQLSPETKAQRAKNAIQEHHRRCLAAWASRKSTVPGGDRREYRFREDQVDKAALAKWTAELQAKGYTVARKNGRVTVGITGSS
jgi:hypothetical protein